MSTPNPKEELVSHLPAMRAFAINLTQNPATADDVVQDAVEKAWTNFDRFEAGTNMRAWLFTILRNAFYSSQFKVKRAVADVDGIHTEALTEKPLHDGSLQMNGFRAAFAQLSNEHREALLLVGASGFSYEETAEMCGVAVDTVKSRIGRARQRLADLMDLEEEDKLEMTDNATLSVLTASRAASF